MNEAPGLNGSHKEQLTCLLLSAQRVAETTDETVSEQLVNHQQNRLCRRLYPSQCTRPSVSLLILCYRRLSPALQVFT